jgi:hypothetical protein
MEEKEKSIHRLGGFGLDMEEGMAVVNAVMNLRLRATCNIGKSVSI